MTGHRLPRRLPGIASWAAFVALASLAPAAGAHVAGPAAPSGFASGFAHPFSGLDHQLAMLAVGLWAWQQGGRRRIALPLLFVAGAGAGLGLAALGLSLLVAPPLLAGTVAALGLGIALALRSGFALVSLAVFVGGLLHGHAHASDLASAAAPLSFAAGFLLATAALHAAGFGLAAFAPTRARVTLARAAGVGIAVAGALLVVLAPR